MALTIGTQLGSHEITGSLGKGGMVEVYRARDLKLKREVALKMLPEEFSRDSDRVSYGIAVLRPLRKILTSPKATYGTLRNWGIVWQTPNSVQLKSRVPQMAAETCFFPFNSPLAFVLIRRRGRRLAP